MSVPDKTDLTVQNIQDIDIEYASHYLFSLLRRHDKNTLLDRELFVELLGEYAALYQYASEMYAYMIGRVRTYQELKDNFRKMKAMDKRDMMECYLKAVKFEYDSLSRKVTVISQEDVD